MEGDGSASGAVAGAYAPHAVDDCCLGPFQYLCEVPGKNVRGMLIDAFQTWLQIPEEKIRVIKGIVTELHNASLLIDDIEDNSRLRRGVPVAHSIFGVASTINCANYVYFIALEKCLMLGNAEAMNCTVSELLNLHRGQGQDITWRDSLQCPTEEEYFSMVTDKTGGLFRLAVGLMQAFSANKTDYVPLLNKLALYFQIRDDLLNLSSEEYMAGKSFCEDLTEGKFSFPIIHCIRSEAPGPSQLKNILKQKTEDAEVKKYAVSCMRRRGSLKYTRLVIDRLREEADAEIRRLGGHEALTVLLDALDSKLQPASFYDAEKEGGGADRDPKKT